MQTFGNKNKFSFHAMSGCVFITYTATYQPSHQPLSYILTHINIFCIVFIKQTFGMNDCSSINFV